MNGVPLIDDVPLNVSTAVDTWRIAERTEPPATIAEALAPLNVQHITPESCRGLSSQISRAALVGKVVIADAVSDADLDRLVAASWRITNCRYVGSAGLVSAIARRLGARSDALADGLPSAAGALPAGSLVVVGTSESTARRQLDEISRQGGVVVGVPLTRSSDNGPVDVTAIASHLERTTVALTIRRGPPETSTRDGLSGDAAAALGAAVEHVLAATARPPRLMLTGGHTARVVLDRLRLTRLRVHGVVHYGAVALDADNRARVITRPGSFGDVDSFVLGARYLADWSFSTGNGATEQKTRSIDPRRGAS